MNKSDKINPDIQQVEGGREITFAASSDTQLYRCGWFGEYLETLVHSERAIDTSFIQQGDAPILFDHSRRCENIAGKIRGYEIKDGKLYVRAFFADNLAEQKDAADRIAAGAITSVSVGWDYLDSDVDFRTEDNMTEEERATGAWYAISYNRWKPLEVSLVTIPADTGVGIGRGREIASYSRDKHIASLARERLGERLNRRDNNDNKRSNKMPKQTEKENAAIDANAETEHSAARAQTEPTTEPATAKRGYEVVDEHKVLLGKYHSPVRERAIGEGWDEATARAKVLETMAAATAGVPTETGAMTPQSVADDIKRTAAVHIDKGQNNFSIARYAREAISGKLKSGLGSVEAEMHTDAENARTGPALLANEFALPARLMLSDKRFVAAAQRKYGARTIEIGAAGGADGASAYANGAFDEMQLIHALYARSGILPMVSVFPELLTSNIEIPIESQRSEVEFATGETTTRDDTEEPAYNRVLEWKWREVYGQFTVSRQLIDQTTVLFDRIMMLLTEDIPRGINRAILTGQTRQGIAGGAGAPMGIYADVAAASQVIPSANRVAPAAAAQAFAVANAWGIVNGLKTAVERANAHYGGEGVYLLNSAMKGRLEETEKFADSSGEPIIKYATMPDGATVGRIAGSRAILDNHIPDTFDGSVAGAATNKIKQSVGAATSATAVTSANRRNMLIYCIPQEIKLGYFSDLTMIVDPYSGKKSGGVELQIRQALDWQFLHPEAFAYNANLPV